MAATKNDASAAGLGVNLMHPFKLDVLQGPIDQSTGKPTYKTSLNWHSALYESVTEPDKAGKEYLKFKKIKISNLDFEQEVKNEIYQKQYCYCILNVTIENLSPKEAKIIFEMGNQDPSKLLPIKFESAENFNQKEARVILAAIAYDNKYIPANAQISSNSKDQSKKNSLYVIQYVHSNLLMTNMVLMGTPVVYPVPFPGAPTSIDGSDQLL